LAETLVRLDGVQEIIVERLTENGFFKTKSEVIRAGILGLGKEYKIFNSLEDVEKELVIRKMQKISDEIDSGKRKVFSEAEVKKKYGFK